MTNSVQVNIGTLTLPTYPEPKAESLPMFAENRVHQRTSGNPYPNPVVLRVNRTDKSDQTYRCITLENEYLRLEILPELGGRIYSALDKTTGYDFFYKQHVIKPALIGCLGSWISGGMEFNWPFHHRASTYMPVDDFVEQTATGGAIIWLSEHDPIDRMKGMVGIALEPGCACFETRMRLCNRTPERHSFLWWENTAVPVNEQYQIFFPPDVSYVRFHYKRSITTYPVASNALGVYNGIRYPHDTDISMHKNTRQPTSYFCAPSKYDFFGGYDHGKQCGVVHIANHHTSPGKKMFTWAYNQLSASWERALTDTDGAYAELMAGSYSDNQPDFAWLEPYETKCFSQYWYPIGALGVPDYATSDGAIHWSAESLTVQLTHNADAEITVENDGRAVFHAQAALQAGKPMQFNAPCAGVHSRVRVTAGGRVLLDYTVQPKPQYNLPECTEDMPNFKTERSAQELYLEGVHVQQYRDPAVEPDAYWTEALLRDPAHSASLLALADYRLRQCRFAEAEELAVRARKELTHYNQHPESGRVDLLLGRIYLAQHRPEEAADAFWRASWNFDVYSAAMTGIAIVDGLHQDYAQMAEHTENALRCNADHPLAAAYRALALHQLGQTAQAVALLTAQLHRDPLNHLNRYALLICGGLTADAFYSELHSDPVQTALDVYFDLAQAGFVAEGQTLLRGIARPNAIILYLLGEPARAEQLTHTGTFPFRAAEYDLLQRVTSEHPELAGAQELFGNLLYAKRQYTRAAACWTAASISRPERASLKRNLAIAYYSHLNRKNEVLPLMERAVQLAPHEEQLVFETAYVRNCMGLPAGETADWIHAHAGAGMRDDLCIELVRAYNLSGQYERALAVLNAHEFVPCEGGEHAVADQYMFAHFALGRQLLANNQPEAALAHFSAAQVLPQNLGAGLWNEVKLVPHQYYEMVCLDRLNRVPEADAIAAHILALQVDYFSDMHLRELPYYQALTHTRGGDYLTARAEMDAYQKRAHAGLSVADPGFFGTTPFFLSFCPCAADARAAVMNRLLGYFDLFAETGEAARHFAAASSLDPMDLYAGLEAKLL